MLSEWNFQKEQLLSVPLRLRDELYHLTKNSHQNSMEIKSARLPLIAWVLFIRHLCVKTDENFLLNGTIQFFNKHNGARRVCTVGKLSCGKDRSISFPTGTASRELQRDDNSNSVKRQNGSVIFCAFRLTPRKEE